MVVVGILRQMAINPSSPSRANYATFEDGCLLGCSAVWTGMSLPTLHGDGYTHRPDDGGSTDL
jgi:hypothetical protein